MVTAVSKWTGSIVRVEYWEVVKYKEIAIDYPTTAIILSLDKVRGIERKFYNLSFAISFYWANVNVTQSAHISKDPHRHDSLSVEVISHRQRLKVLYETTRRTFAHRLK